MPQLLSRACALNELLRQGRRLEALERFYHPAGSVQENEQMPTLGKAANRQREEAFEAGLLELRRATPIRTAAGPGFTITEWLYDFTHRHLGVRCYFLVAVQQWQAGLVIHEKRYYQAYPF